MLVEMKEGKVMRECLSIAMKLKTVGDWKRVFITLDLVKDERQKNIELREEL